MMLSRLFALLLVFITQTLALLTSAVCFAADELEKVIVRGYEGNGGVSVELARFGSPKNERALLRIRGFKTETGTVLHQVSVQRSAVSTFYVENTNGVSRVIFEVRMHQGFIPCQNNHPYVLGESARVERSSKIGMEAQKIVLEESGSHQKAIEMNLIIQSP